MTEQRRGLSDAVAQLGVLRLGEDAIGIMGKSGLMYPKCFAVDRDCFAAIAALIRHEYRKHPERYADTNENLGLSLFVSDVERYQWDESPDSVTDMFLYCSSAGFLNCLRSVRDVLIAMGDNFSEEYKRLLPLGRRIRIKRLRFWLEKLTEIVDDYQGFRQWELIHHLDV